MDPLAVDADKFCEITGLGRTTTFALIKAGRLKTVKIGRRRLILMESVRRLFEQEKKD